MERDSISNENFSIAVENGVINITGFLILLTRKENIHIADNVILEYDEQTKGQKWGILQDDVKNNAPDIYAATAIITTICWRSKFTKEDQEEDIKIYI